VIKNFAQILDKVQEGLPYCNYTTKGHTIKAETRQFLSVVTLATLGALFIVTETHRVVIGWAWNLFVAFHDTYIAF
jgi:hypothetical protein